MLRPGRAGTGGAEKRAARREFLNPPVAGVGNVQVTMPVGPDAGRVLEATTRGPLVLALPMRLQDMSAAPANGSRIGVTPTAVSDIPANSKPFSRSIQVGKTTSARSGRFAGESGNIERLAMILGPWIIRYSLLSKTPAKA